MGFKLSKLTGTFCFPEMFLVIGMVVLAVIILTIILGVSLYKCRKVRRGRGGKEGSPLNAA